MKFLKKIKNIFNKLYPLPIFIFFIILVLFLTNHHIGSANDASRIATMKSLVEEKTFIINKTNYGSCDVIKRNNNLYSSKPPVLSLAGTGIYYILHNFFRLNLPTQNKTFTENSAYYIITLILVGIPYLLLLFYFYKTLSLLKIEKKYYTILILGLGLGTLYLPYSTTLNNHIPAGSFLFLGFYYLLKIKFNKNNLEKNKKYIALSGFFTSLSAVIDLPTGLTFLVLFFLYFLITKQKKYIYYYIIAAIPIILIHLFFTFQITGDILPAQLHQKFYHYTNSYWNNPNNIDNIKDSIPLYIYNIFFGSYGLFFYTPLLILGFYFMIKLIKGLFKKEAILILFGFLIISLYYIIKVKSYGGASYGFRWFIAITPLLYWFVIFTFKKKNYKIINFFAALLILSVFISFIGIINPWSFVIVNLSYGTKIITINSAFIFNLLSF